MQWHAVIEPGRDLLGFTMSALRSNSERKGRVGAFHVACRVENVADRRKSARLSKLLVDTGSEYTWISSDVLEKIGVQREKKDLQFVMANGQRVTRSVGFAVVHVEGTLTVDEVVFAERGDLALLGARSLEGLNLAVDPARKRLVAAGPLPAAGSG